MSVFFASNYASSWGWAVFPCHSIASDGLCTCGNPGCKSEGKHPRTSRGCKDATLDEAQITAWFAGQTDVNIGIATGPISNLVVVDVDVGKGANWKDLLVGGLDESIFNTPKVSTGAGFHLYYRLPPNVDLKNSAGRLGKFIDLRSSGGYVIAPPSKHISGNRYEFVNSVEELLDFPQPWLDILNGPKLPQTSGKQTSVGTPLNTYGDEATVIDTNGNSHFYVPPPGPKIIVPDLIAAGGRNNGLTAIAGSLRDRGLSEGAIYAALNIENLRICKPPLDDSEIHQIAHSVGRYGPRSVLDPLTDTDDGVDHENTLKPYLLGDFLDSEFEELEVLSFHISKTEIGIVQAPTNAGKTTILRNIALAMACGRPFEPFFSGHRPIKLAYFDFESSAQRAQPDLKKMVEALTPDEMKLARENMILVPKGMMNGGLFQFNTGEAWVQELLVQNGVEFVFVDNISAAYDLNDENSNAEINRKVIKPLLKMAYKGDCAFLFAHHYGKGKNELESAGVHAGRGASNLQSLSQTVINMFGNVSKGEPITFECAKSKLPGGNYQAVFELKDDRWFHKSNRAAAPKPVTCEDTLKEFINDHIFYPNTVTPAQLAEHFDGVFGLDAIKKALAKSLSDGYISKHGKGEYAAGPEVKPIFVETKKSADESDENRPVNFYEKESE